MRNKTFPKENQKKANETIKDLKALLRQKDKEISFLRSEITNILKPVRVRKSHEEAQNRSHDDWRKDFVKRFKREVLNEES